MSPRSLRTPGNALIHAPVLTTERLIIRAPEAGDFESAAAFWATERSVGMGGPLTRAAAWRAFAAELGHWLLRGYGLFHIVERDTGLHVGHAGFWNPEGWAEVELGWAVYDGFEGRGFAREAALRLRRYAYDTLGWGPLSSVIAPDNTRSIALAERLGAAFERDWTSPSGKPALIYRHPGPEEAAA